MENEYKINADYTVSENGVSTTVLGKGKIAYMLPAFYFDGEEYTEIKHGENTLEIKYGGWVCRYSTDGKIVDADNVGCNRNGYYKVFYAEESDKLCVKIEIFREI